ncbi:MAG TPA: hypothetical protein ENJ84_10750 [Gammaproteobacteria bacterium]|nr:hypothetical protein [Gammaproteobacteria bacterium]
MPSQRTVFGYLILAILLLTGCPNTASVSEDDARLRNLTILGGSLQPGFSPDQTDYILEAGKKTENFTLTPQTQHFKATVEIDGKPVQDSFPSQKIPFDGTERTIRIQVTSADGLQLKTYTLTAVAQGQAPKNPVNPDDGNGDGDGNGNNDNNDGDTDTGNDTPTTGDSDDRSDATLETLSLSSGALVPVFQSNQFEYSADISALEDRVQVSAGPANPKARIRINNTDVTTGERSEPITLPEGTSVIRIDVIAEDGTQKTYTITVNHLSIGAFVQTAYLKAIRASTDAGFGGGVAVSGKTIAIGAPEESSGGVRQSGAVYLFEHVAGNWKLIQRIEHPEPAPGDLFGQSLAIKGDTLAVGTSGESTRQNSSGAVFVYHRQNGKWQTDNQDIDKIKATPVEFGHRFGYNVVLSDPTHLAVASLRSVAFPQSGAVYVFSYDGRQWQQETRIAGDNFGASDRYGHSIDLEGNRLAIGSFAPDQECTSQINTDEGSVHIYERKNGNWALAEVLHAFQPDSGDRFGFSVDLDGNRLLVGAPCEDGQNNNQTQQGAAYEFIENGGEWRERFKFVAPDGSPHSLFGDKVALAGNTAIISASFQGQTTSSAAGKAYLFTGQAPGQWQFNNTLQPDNLDDGDRFGINLAYGDGILVISSPKEDSRNPRRPLDNSVNNSGAAYVFEP